MDLPTPLRKTPRILLVSSFNHASFNPAHITLHRAVTSTPSRLSQMPTRPVHQHLSFNSNIDQEPDNTLMQIDSLDDDQDLDSTPESSDEEEDFPTAPIDDEHWTTDIVPERTFCIHENGLPNNVCHYPCPYGNSDTVSYMDSLDLSDILDYEDHMVTTSDDKELPALEEVPY